MIFCILEATAVLAIDLRDKLVVISNNRLEAGSGDRESMPLNVSPRPQLSLNEKAEMKKRYILLHDLCRKTSEKWGLFIFYITFISLVYTIFIICSVYVYPYLLVSLIWVFIGSLMIFFQCIYMVSKVNELGYQICVLFSSYFMRQVYENEK